MSSLQMVSTYIHTADDGDDSPLSAANSATDHDHLSTGHQGSVLSTVIGKAHADDPYLSLSRQDRY
jgi:hypothetical protein